MNHLYSRLSEITLVRTERVCPSWPTPISDPRPPRSSCVVPFHFIFCYVYASILQYCCEFFICVAGLLNGICFSQHIRKMALASQPLFSKDISFLSHHVLLLPQSVFLFFEGWVSPVLEVAKLGFFHVPEEYISGILELGNWGWWAEWSGWCPLPFLQWPPQVLGAGSNWLRGIWSHLILLPSGWIRSWWMCFSWVGAMYGFLGVAFNFIVTPSVTGSPLRGWLCLASAWAFDDFSWISLLLAKSPAPAQILRPIGAIRRPTRSSLRPTRNHRNCGGYLLHTPRATGNCMLWHCPVFFPEGFTLDPLSLTVLSTAVDTLSFKNLRTQLGTTFLCPPYPELQRAHAKCSHKFSVASDRSVGCCTSARKHDSYLSFSESCNLHNLSFRDRLTRTP